MLPRDNLIIDEVIRLGVLLGVQEVPNILCALIPHLYDEGRLALIVEIEASEEKHLALFEGVRYEAHEAAGQPIQWVTQHVPLFLLVIFIEIKDHASLAHLKVKPCDNQVQLAIGVFLDSGSGTPEPPRHGFKLFLCLFFSLLIQVNISDLIGPFAVELPSYHKECPLSQQGNRTVGAVLLQLDSGVNLLLYQVYQKERVVRRFDCAGFEIWCLRASHHIEELGINSD